MLYICSTTVVPSGAYGTWWVEPCTLEGARKLMEERAWMSAVGHQSTADLMSEVLGIEVPMNRLTVQAQEGDTFLCFKLNSRPPEGAILDKEMLESIGYSFCTMDYTTYRL